MATLGTMKTRIADEMVRDDLSSQIGDAITTAISIWEVERFYFNEKRFALATEASTEYYALTLLTNTDGSALSTGETLLEIDTVTATVNGNVYRLIERTHGYIDDVQAPSSMYRGQPAEFGLYANQLRLSPIPDAVYTLTISGLAQLATLSSDAVGNGWTTEAEALIRNQAKVYLYRDILRDGGGTAAAEAAMAQALAMLERRSSMKLKTGSVRPWGNV